MPKIEPITAQSIRAALEGLVIALADREVRLSWAACSAKLGSATPQQRQTAELSPGGYGVHWPMIDEELTVAGLLRRAEKKAKG